MAVKLVPSYCQVLCCKASWDLQDMRGRQSKGKGKETMQGPNLIVGVACHAPAVEALGDGGQGSGG